MLGQFSTKTSQLRFALLPIGGRGEFHRYLEWLGSCRRRNSTASAMSCSLFSGLLLFLPRRHASCCTDRIEKRRHGVNFKPPLTVVHDFLDSARKPGAIRGAPARRRRWRRESRSWSRNRSCGLRIAGRRRPASAASWIMASSNWISPPAPRSACSGFSRISGCRI